jgi:nitrogen regulatory protein P-II 2
MSVHGTAFGSHNPLIPCLSGLARKLHCFSTNSTRIVPEASPLTDESAGNCMKLITAVIKPFKLDEVRQAVADIGIQGVTVTEVQGYGRQHGHTEFYRGAEYRIDFLPKAKIELAVDDSIAEQVMEAVCNVARTGKTGDGKVWILDLEQALRVRTGETGPDAI